MGMNVGGGGRGGRRKRKPMGDINVTPMVDVMLVLLVIFMVTAPLVTTGVSVDLPKAKAPAMNEQDNKPLYVTVQGDGKLFLNDSPVTLEQLPEKVKAIAGANPDVRIYVRGDAASQYGVVMQALGALYAGGFTKAALITQPASAKAKK